MLEKTKHQHRDENGTLIGKRHLIDNPHKKEETIIAHNITIAKEILWINEHNKIFINPEKLIETLETCFQKIN
jgi:hypothetical protein